MGNMAARSRGVHVDGLPVIIEISAGLVRRTLIHMANVPLSLYSVEKLKYFPLPLTTFHTPLPLQDTFLLKRYLVT
jgi:hypothetical protein